MGAADTKNLSDIGNGALEKRRKYHFNMMNKVAKEIQDRCTRFIEYESYINSEIASVPSAALNPIKDWLDKKKLEEKPFFKNFVAGVKKGWNQTIQGPPAVMDITEAYDDIGVD